MQTVIPQLRMRDATREMVVIDPDGNRLRFATDPDLPQAA